MLYLGVKVGKLRFFAPDGHRLMLPEEEANQQLQQANQHLKNWQNADEPQELNLSKYLKYSIIQ
ncbi:MAG: hypothetical protein RM347_016910 [Nostoc sp. ChiQUE02]|uniref:hypothetical protein n=1 Tax=Nostoc sp. ChiQUE02 TaxID=3075377 RepID=UPI002AD572D4|nr:hypothetical protein [Nostoc sp. ChiQUE02]MDZ8229061.1 hypothetical protein [Nostoc sp. ChiQUE02]